MRKAQVSLELLIVTLAFLGALALWFTGINEVRSSAAMALDAHAGKIAADRIAGAVNSVCLMGRGNSRSLKVCFPQKTTVSSEGNLTVGALSRKVYCPVKASFEAEGITLIIIENNGGVITVLPQEQPSDS